jgi:hypothetical protein
VNGSVWQRSVRSVAVLVCLVVARPMMAQPPATATTAIDEQLRARPKAKGSAASVSMVRKGNRAVRLGTPAASSARAAAPAATRDASPPPPRRVANPVKPNG